MSAARHRRRVPPTAPSAYLASVATRLLPLFPLPLVLFPGVRVPLHVFEPRYRALLVDRLAADRRFGIVSTIPGLAERALPVGRVGCVAHVEENEPLPDGRSNIVVRGTERFALRRFVDDAAPYHVAEVATYDDEPESRIAVDLVADELRAVFARVVRVVHADRSDAVRALPDDGANVAFAIAAMIDLDVVARQRILESRSALARSRELHALLQQAVEMMEVRAAVREAREDRAPGLEA